MHDRHQEVEHHHVGADGVEQVQSLGAVRGGQRLEAPLPQDVGDHFADGRLVFYDQHDSLCRSHHDQS